jgi:mRNA interferase MazF
MIVPLTSNVRRAQAAGNVLLAPRETGLDKPSVALVCQVMTIDKELLTDLVGSLGRRARAAIDAGLKLALGLS